jgi:hypothetical protein
MPTNQRLMGHRYIGTTALYLNEIHEAARMRIGRVSINESGCPCADHATACADRNRGRKIRADIVPARSNYGFVRRCSAMYWMTFSTGGISRPRFSLAGSRP